jgi:hypothetical protein
VEARIQIQRRDCSSSDAPWLATVTDVAVVVAAVGDDDDGFAESGDDAAAAVVGRVNDVDAAQDDLMLTLYSSGATDMMERGYTTKDCPIPRSDANYSALLRKNAWSGTAPQIPRSRNANHTSIERIRTGSCARGPIPLRIRRKLI